MERGERGWLGAADALALVGDVVHHNVVAHLIRRGVKNPARIEAGKLIDKTLPVEIGAEHKSIDPNPALRAALHFFERFVNDPAVEESRAPAAVEPSATVQRGRRGLAIGNQYDLPVGGLVRA